MILYLAGGVSGNLNPAWKRAARGETLEEALKHENFWPGGESRHWIHDAASPIKENETVPVHGQRDLLQLGCKRDMDPPGGGPDGTIHSEPSHPDKIQRRSEPRTQHNRGGFDPVLKDHKPFILESFFYADADTERLIPMFGDFLLDSGAFTFMMNTKTKVDWDEYIERYADFIKRNGVKKYFELDIDSVVGFDKVMEYRQRLEKLTGSRCIPVWHKSRGLEQYKRDAEQYDYVAIGGIVSKEIKQNEYKAFPTMISIAHKSGAKVHGLGFTNLEGLTKYHFDSVDSTAWTTGNRFGYIYRFDGKTMTKIKVPAGKRIKESRRAALINYTEWIKFQKYAETKL